MSCKDIRQTVNELTEEFDELFDWEERYQLIIEIGDEISPMEEALKTPETKVEGCVSQVWLVAEPVEADPPRIRFTADSDSPLVRGLIAILLKIYSGRSPQEILDFDIEKLFNRLELREHLSRSRSNGLRSMVRRIRELAAEHVTGSGALAS